MTATRSPGGRRRVSLASVALASLALAAGAAGCGVPVDPEPRALSTDELPMGLFESMTTTTTSPAPVADAPEQVSATVEVFMVDRSRLVRATRLVTQPITLGQVIGALLTGPSELEDAAGYVTAIDPRTRLLEASVDNGVARLNLSESFLDTPTQAQILAVGQLVLTATGLEDVEEVSLSLNGRQLGDIPAADGTLRGELLTAADYEALILDQAPVVVAPPS